ncbi:MAG TPA: phage tail protein [Candidatus Obscuribacterales bacterium]
MGKSSSQTIGYKHFLDVHAVMCEGVIDKIFDLRVDDRQAWINDSVVTTFTVDATELFGGEDREGGVSGAVDVLDGLPSQTPNAFLVANQDANSPAYRGVSSLVFKDFYWGNNPYLKPWSVTIQRIDYQSDGTVQWYTDKSKIISDSIPNDIGTVFVDSGIGPFSTEPSVAGNNVILGERGVDGEYTSPLTWFRFDADIQRSFTVPQNITVNGQTVALDTGEDGFMIRPEQVFGGGTAVFGVVPQNYVPLPYEALEFRMVCDLAQTEQSSGFGAQIDYWQTSGGSRTNFINVPVNSNGYDWTTYDSDWIPLNASLANPRFRILFAGGELAFIKDVRIQLRFTTGDRTDPIIYDMNPAHIIREVITNDRWGLGFPEADVDDTSFTEAADTLFSEFFGLSGEWSPDESDPLQLINRVQEHIGAEVYVDRSDGKFHMRLIRDDYGSGDITYFTDDDIISMEIQKERRHEIPNYITLEYTDRKGRKKATLTETNPASIRDVGKVISTTIDATWIHKVSLASRVLHSNVRSMTVPKWKGTAVLTRKASRLNPGDVISFTSTDYGLNGEVMRVLDIDVGDGENNQVTVIFVQDVFSLGETAVIDPDARPTDPLRRTALDSPARIVQETPYYEIVRQVGDTEADSLLADDPTVGYLQVAAGSPGNGHTGARIYVDDKATSPVEYTQQEFLDFAPYAVLSAAVGKDPTETTLTFSSQRRVSEVVAGTLAQIGDEIVRVDSVSESGATIGRGALDTVPTEHAAGEYIIFWQDYAVSSTEEYNASEELDVKIRTRTGTDQLALASATTENIVFANRAIRPYPANDLKWETLYEPTDTIFDGSELTWVGRNRLTQTTSNIVDYDDATITEEAGTTYRLDYYSIIDGVVGGSPYNTESSVSTPKSLSSATYTSGIPADTDTIRLQVTAVRDGYDSWTSPYVDVPYVDWRITEDGEVRLTEDGIIRITEG